MKYVALAIIFTKSLFSMTYDNAGNSFGEDKSTFEQAQEVYKKISIDINTLGLVSNYFKNNNDYYKIILKERNYPMYKNLDDIESTCRHLINCLEEWAFLNEDELNENAEEEYRILEEKWARESNSNIRL